MGIDVKTIFDIRLENENDDKVNEIERAKIFLQKNGYVVKKVNQKIVMDVVAQCVWHNESSLSRGYIV